MATSTLEPVIVTLEVEGHLIAINKKDFDYFFEIFRGRRMKLESHHLDELLERQGWKTININ